MHHIHKHEQQIDGIAQGAALVGRKHHSGTLT
jgi:hypothetical protein